MSDNISFGAGVKYEDTTDHAIKLAKAEKQRGEWRAEREREEEKERNSVRHSLPEPIMLKDYIAHLTEFNKLSPNPKLYGSIVTLESVFDKLEEVYEETK